MASEAPKTTLGPEEIASLQATVATLLAKEQERDRLAAEKEALKARLDEIKNVKANREVRELGTATAFRQCGRPKCADFDVKHEVEIQGQETVQFVKDAQGNVTSTIENSWIHWNLVNPEDGTCPTCKRSCGFTGEPGSMNVLENADGWVTDNRSAWLEKMRKQGRSQQEMDRWEQRWMTQASS